METVDDFLPGRARNDQTLPHENETTLNLEFGQDRPKLAKIRGAGLFSTLNVVDQHLVLAVDIWSKVFQHWIVREYSEDTDLGATISREEGSSTHCIRDQVRLTSVPVQSEVVNHEFLPDSL